MPSRSLASASNSITPPISPLAMRPVAGSIFSVSGTRVFGWSVTAQNESPPVHTRPLRSVTAALFSPKISCPATFSMVISCAWAAPTRRAQPKTAVSRASMMASYLARAISAARRSAAIMESGRARFFPAISKAVPWSGLVRGKGRPRVTFTPESKAWSFSGMRP